MVRIGHASQDENKKTKGGASGDQTGKEVCVRNWYKRDWHSVIRAKDELAAEQMAVCCEYLCKTNIVGYDQNQRNSLRSELDKVGWIPTLLATPCETDCSAFMAVCAEYAGINMDAQYIAKNAPTTANMVDKFYKTGAFDIYTNSTYTTRPDHLKRGDILVGKGHTVMVLDDGPKQYEKPVLSKGDKGSWVLSLQNKLIVKGYKIKADSEFGNNTEIALMSFQGQCIDSDGRPLEKDGICGKKSWSKL